MSEERVLRLRCPRDVDDPSKPHQHYAADVRLPLEIVALGEMLHAIGNCVCGAEMIVLGNAPDPWTREPDPWTREPDSLAQKAMPEAERLSAEVHRLRIALVGITKLPHICSATVGPRECPPCAAHYALANGGGT